MRARKNSRINARRWKLILKQGRSGLDEAEAKELDLLQSESAAEMLRRFPSPTLADGLLGKIEDHLAGLRDKGDE